MSKLKIIILFAAVVFIGGACSKKAEPTVFNQSNQKEVSTMTNSDTTPNPSSVEEGSKVTIQTSLGNITLEFFAQDAPKAVANFIKLAESGFYNGVTFHRVIPGFMIQGGDPLSKDADPTNDGTGGPGYMFEDELNASTASYQTGYKKGVLAMANAGPNTNGSQFFIMLADYPLPHNYTIFGRVTVGQDIVDKIGAVKTGSNDRPLTNVVIQTATVQK